MFKLNSLFVKDGIYGAPKTVEKSDHIKVFKLADVTVDLQGSRKYIFYSSRL